MKTASFFFAPEDVGGGGGTALADSISTTAPADFDIANYVPPTPQSVEEDILNGADDAPPEPVRQPEQKKPAPQQKQQTKPAPKPDAKKPADAPAAPEMDPEKAPVAQLRTAYQTAKSDLEATRKELETLRTDHPELKTTRAKLKEVESKAAEYEKARVDYERRLAMHDPAATQRVKDMDRAFNEEMGPLVSTMPRLQAEYGALVRDYQKVQALNGKPEFQDAFDEFEQKLVDAYGERRADRVMDLVNRGAEHIRKVQRVQQELHQDADKFLYDQQVSSYAKDRERFEKDVEGALDIDPAIAAEDPYNPLLFLQHCKKEAPEQFDEYYGKLKQVVELAMLPPRPRQKSDFPGLSDDQIADTLRKEAQQAGQAKKVMSRLALQGAMAQYFMRPFLSKLKKLEERLAGEVEDAPDPSSTGGKAAGSKVLDLNSYEAPAIDENEVYR